jgi:hypothetical protein
VTAPKEPRTAAGRALRKLAIDADDLDLTKYILAIEAEAMTAPDALLREADMDTINDACLLLRTAGDPVSLGVAERLSGLGDRVYAALRAATPPASAPKPSLAAAIRGWSYREATPPASAGCGPGCARGYHTATQPASAEREAGRLLGYLWFATGKNPDIRVCDLFDENDPIVDDVLKAASAAEARDERGWSPRSKSTS